MDPKHLHNFIIVPALDHIGLNSLAASRLLLGTAMVESRLKWVRQLSGGPALGLFQMEPTTHDDIWTNWLVAHLDLAHRVAELGCKLWPSGPTQMVGNLLYAAAMARCHYRRVPAPLPSPDDPKKLARYHKIFYNTFLGATEVRRSERIFAKAITITEGR